MLGTSIPKVETIAATFLIVRFLSFISKIGLFHYKKLGFHSIERIQEHGFYSIKIVNLLTKVEKRTIKKVAAMIFG